MKKFLAALFLLSFIVPGVFSQTVKNNDYVTAPSLGVSFLLNDFKTAQLIRSTSLSMVIRNKQLAQINGMSPGLGISYFKGLLNHIDFAASLNGSFVNMQVGSNASSGSSSDNSFLLEGDASVNLKLLTNKYWVNPYLIVGVGASEYKGYYGAFLPLGGGIKVNFFNEAALFITSQYRVPVTPGTFNYHFMYNVGISGIIGQTKSKE